MKELRTEELIVREPEMKKSGMLSQVSDYFKRKTAPPTDAEIKASPFNASGAAKTISDYKKKQKKDLEDAMRD